MERSRRGSAGRFMRPRARERAEKPLDLGEPALAVVGEATPQQPVPAQEIRHLAVEEAVVTDELQLAHEHRRHVVERGRKMVAVPAGVHLVDGALEEEADDFLLVAEVIVQVALADAAVLGDAVGGYRRRAYSLKSSSAASTMRVCVSRVPIGRADRIDRSPT